MNTNIIITAVIVLFLFYLGMEYYLKQRTKKNTMRLANLLLKQDYAEFDKLVKDPQIQETVSPYQRNLLSFNSYLARNDGKNANLAFAQMNQLNLMSQQKINFYGSAQNYYIEQKDQKRAAICHDKLETVRKHDDEKEYFNTIYQVMMKNDVSYQKAIEQRLNHEPDYRKLPDLYLLIHIYQIKKDHQRAKECQELADKLLKKMQTEKKKNKGF